MFLNSKFYIIIILFFFSACNSKTAEEFFDMAFEFEENREYIKAIKSLDKAIEKKPEFRPALLNRGYYKFLLNDYNGAIEDYLKIITFDPHNTMALMNIGNNLKRLNKYRESVHFYIRALNTSGAKKYQKISFNCNILNEFDVDCDYHVYKYEIEYERGVSFFYLEKYALAINDFKNAIEYNYYLSDALYWTGKSYYHLNDTLEAKKHLLKAAKYGNIKAKDLLKKIVQKNNLSE